MLEVTTAGWVASIGLIVGLLALDLLVSAHRPHAVGFREAATWSVFYIAVALIFGVVFAVTAGWEFGAVLRRLRRREEPVDRQPLRLPDHHEHLRSARRAPAEGPRHRHRARADPARAVHRAWRGTPLALLIHVPHLRAAAHRHRSAAVPPPQPGPVGRGQRPGRGRPPPPAVHRPLRGGRLITIVARWTRATPRSPG